MNNAFLKTTLTAAALTVCGVAFAAPTLVSANPAGGSTVTSLKTIETYWNVEGLALSGNWEVPVSVYDLTNRVEVTTGQFDFDWDDPTLFFLNLKSEVTEPGSYAVIIPEGAFLDDMGNPVGEATTLNYVIEDNGSTEDPGDYTVTFDRADPADGSTITSLGSFKTYWNVGDAILGTDYDKVVEFRNDKGEVLATTNMDFDWDDTSLFTFGFGALQQSLPSGTYNVVIPAGILTDDDAVGQNAGVTLTYIYEGAVSAALTPISAYPKDGATIDFNMGSTLATLNFGFDEPIELSDPEMRLKLVKDDGTELESDELKAFNMAGAGYSLIVNFNENPVTYSGAYTITIPAGLVKGKNSGDTNEELSYTYNYIQDKNLVPDDILPNDEPLKFDVFNLTDAEGNVVVDFLNDAPVSLEAFPASLTMNVGFEREECESMVFELQDVSNPNAPVVLYTIWTYIDGENIYTNGERDENGVFHFRLSSRELELYEGHDYSLYVHAYYKFDGVPNENRVSKGEGSLPLLGTKEEFKYSPVTITKVTPEVDSELDENNRSFSVTYSGPVEINLDKVVTPSGPSLLTGISLGAYSPAAAFESIESNSDKTVWTFTIAESDILEAPSTLDCIVSANDMQGRRVRPDDNEIHDIKVYNRGDKDETTQSFSFSCFGACPIVTVEPGASTVTSLYEFSFTCPEAARKSIDYAGISATGDVLEGILRSTSGARVATLVRDDIKRETDKPEGSSDISVIRVTMHLDKEITEPGLYTLDIPSAFFMTGTEFNSMPNKHMTVQYVIDGELTLDAASVVEGSVMSELGLVAVYVGTPVTLAEDAQMIVRTGERDRNPGYAPLHMTQEGSYYRIYADFCDPDNGFAPRVLDPRDQYNNGMGQNYEIIIPEGTILTSAGTSFAEKVINVHSPGANEGGDVETATFVAEFPYHTASISNVVNGEPVQVMLQPAAGWKVEQVFYNGADVTDQVVDNMLVTPAVQGQGSLQALFAFDGEVQVIDGGSSSVESINGTDMKVRIDGTDVIISGLEAGQLIQVCNLGGAIMTSYEVESDTATVKLEKGIYVITIDGAHAIKVAL